MHRWAFAVSLVGLAALPAPAETLVEQKEPVHLVSTSVEGDGAEHVIEAEPMQQKATALRISVSVRAQGVTGVPGRGFLAITDLDYGATPVFWDTMIYPDTGTYPWRRYEKVIRARLPVKKLKATFRLKGCAGEARFRDFRIEEIPAWQERPELEIALLGDSTDMCAYLPDAQKPADRLELLFRDRFPARRITVRSIAESGEYLKRLLGSGRLERELATLKRCDIVVVRYGLNDRGKKITPEDFGKQLEETADRILKRFPKARIVLATTVPPHGGMYEPATKAVAERRKFPLIDLAAFLRAEAARGNGNWHRGKQASVGFRTERNPAANPTGLRGDKHPNAYGVQLIAEHEFKALEPIAAEHLDTAQQ